MAPKRAAPTIFHLDQIASGRTSRERFLTELTLDPHPPVATSNHFGVRSSTERTWSCGKSAPSTRRGSRLVFSFRYLDGDIGKFLNSAFDRDLSASQLQGDDRRNRGHDRDQMIDRARIIYLKLVHDFE
jgi:hypothetical protein